MQYTVDNGIAPDYYFYEPEASVELHPPGTDAREVEVHNAWPRDSNQRYCPDFARRRYSTRKGWRRMRWFSNSARTPGRSSGWIFCSQA